MVHKCLIEAVSLAEHGSRHAGFGGCSTVGLVVVACELTCSKTCVIFLDQGLNLYSLYWQADSSSLSHQGDPNNLHFNSSSHIIMTYRIMLKIGN